MTNKLPLESEIEGYLKEQIQRVNGLCYKFQSSVNGVPDQIVICKGLICLVEVKRPGEKPRANQVHIHNKIKEQGVEVYTVDSFESINHFMRNVLKIEPVDAPIKKKSNQIRSSNTFMV